MEDEDAELRNPFPSPPSHYTKYTNHNLSLLQILNECSPDNDEADQQEVLNDQQDVPEWSLKQLEKPRVDWILDEQEPYYDVFGDRWFVKDKIPSLAELGGTQLYPADPTVDRRPALRSVLGSLLVTYSHLTAALLAPPPTTSSSQSPDWQRHVEWITVLSQNLMAAANDLRPVQARANLEMMMRRQLELRKEETLKLHQTCDTLEGKLAELRAVTKIGTLLRPESAQEMQIDEEPLKETLDETGLMEQDELLRWAEELEG